MKTLICPSINDWRSERRAGHVTLTLGKPGGGVGRRSNGKCGGGTGRHVVPAGSLTQHLERVGRAWPELAPQIREAILTLVEASRRPVKTHMTSPRIRSKATTICAPSTAGAR